MAMTAKSLQAGMAASFAGLLIGWATSGAAAGDSFEKPLLEGDWAAVVEDLEHNASSQDPVARLLMGHASLALNRNNEAHALFLSVSDTNDVEAWAERTALLVADHPANPIAQYLAADALARAGQLDVAIESLMEIAARTDLALAWNALGVASVLNEEWDNAEYFLFRATRSAPKLADAHANRGALGVFREVSIAVGSGALDTFDTAIAINPEFALAFNGRGCLNFGAGNFDEARQDFLRAIELDPYLEVAKMNLVLAESYQEQLLHFASLDVPPGMTLQSALIVQRAEIESQKQALARSTSGDQFDRDLDAFPHMSRPDQLATLDKHGIEKFRAGLILRQADTAAEIMLNNEEVHRLHQRVGSLARWKTNFAIADAALTAVSATRWAGSTIGKGWQAVLGSGSIRVAKAATASRMDPSAAKTVLSVAPLRLDPVALAVSIGKSLVKIGGAVTDDRLGALAARQTQLTERTGLLQLQHRARSAALDVVDDVWVQRMVPTTTAPISTPSRGATVRSSSIPVPRTMRPGSAPGGVRTELAHAFIDQGGWPVMTVFSLAYPVATLDQAH
jgi:tetratricopeptide (TPR) repeat protein